jgi:hypothetical protein
MRLPTSEELSLLGTGAYVGVKIWSNASTPSLIVTVVLATFTSLQANIRLERLGKHPKFIDLLRLPKLEASGIKSLQRGSTIMANFIAPVIALKVTQLASRLFGIVAPFSTPALWPVVIIGIVAYGTLYRKAKIESEQQIDTIRNLTDRIKPCLQNMEELIKKLNLDLVPEVEYKPLKDGQKPECTTAKMYMKQVELAIELALLGQDLVLSSNFSRELITTHPNGKITVTKEMKIFHQNDWIKVGTSQVSFSYVPVIRAYSYSSTTYMKAEMNVTDFTPVKEM